MLWAKSKPTSQEIEENKRLRNERDALFLGFGIDRAKMIGFVIDTAEPLESPVLDIGTGKGLAAMEMAARGARVVTLDRSAEELRSAWLSAVGAGLDNHIELHQLDAAGLLPFDDGIFPLVTMVNVMHHVENIEDILSQVSRVLSPRGRFLISDFTEEGFAILDKIHGGEGSEHERHNRIRMENIAGILPRFGLRCTERDSRFHQCVMIARKV